MLLYMYLIHLVNPLCLTKIRHYPIDTSDEVLSVEKSVSRHVKSLLCVDKRFFRYFGERKDEKILHIIN